MFIEPTTMKFPAPFGGAESNRMSTCQVEVRPPNGVGVGFGAPP